MRGLRNSVMSLYEASAIVVSPSLRATWSAAANRF
jgi:hypothetical protein